MISIIMVISKRLALMEMTYNSIDLPIWVKKTKLRHLKSKTAIQTNSITEE